MKSGSSRRIGKEQIVDWSRIPTFEELESYYDEVSYTLLEPAFHFRLKEFEYLKHDVKKVDKLIALYEESGFETRRVIQDPFGHPGPAVACPIGFPFNLPKMYPELKRYKKWICRLHVDVCRSQQGFLLSVPHIEPDPIFHPFSHLKNAFLHRNVLRGKVPLELLQQFLGLS